jgi:hypothetical protein
VDAGPYTSDYPFAGRAQEIALEFDGGEVIGSVGHVGEGAIAAGGICEGNDHGGVQVSVGGEQFGAQGEAAGEAPWLHAEEFNADQAGQISFAACVKLIEGGHKAGSGVKG